MGKRSKGKRFIQHGKNSVEKHAERFPYRSTLEEAENNNDFMADSTLGGAEYGE